eukprot:TRINITY_DN2207_c0_g2_i5.p3 TRINITY_DN2207_c0_g2~~TRINITY_DN2207_c0_g2_i5.p3  ORF type:complete len:120 (-),score=12.55 TRINITY_DN2207_c0_g2_i5:155-514(-)
MQKKKNGGSGAGGGSPPNPTGVPRRCTIQDEMHESLGQRDDGARQQHTHTQPKHTVTYENLFGRTETGEENGRQRARGGAKWSGVVGYRVVVAVVAGRDGTGRGGSAREKKKTKKKKVK